MPSPYASSSQLQFPFLSNQLLFINNKRRNHNKVQRGKLVVLARISFSLSTTTPIKEERHESLKFYKGASRLRVQNFVDKIRALPIKERTEILNTVEENGGNWTISDFNDLLLALIIANEADLAFKLYSNLSCYGFAPDSWTFSILIRCHCKKNDLDEAKRVLDHITETGYHPDVVTVTFLLNSFCKKGKLQKAFEVFEVMGKIGCKPTVQTYNCLLKGLCYVGKVEEAYEMLMDIKKDSIIALDIYTYTIVMDGFCKVGRSNEAIELLNEAIEMGLTPSVVTYNTLFNAYCKEGRPMKGFAVLKRMKERNCIPDHISYSTLLNGLLKWGKIREAFMVYKEMEGIGFEVDERMMNTLLRGLCRKSWEERDLVNHAYEVFDKMINKRVPVIESSTYGLLIRALCMGRKIEEALVHLQQMIRMGFIPRTITFNNIIQALCLEGKVDEALLILVVMCEHGKIPSRTSYDILINELNRQRRLLGACNVYGAALKQRVIPHKKPQE